MSSADSDTGLACQPEQQALRLPGKAKVCRREERLRQETTRADETLPLPSATRPDQTLLSHGALAALAETGLYLLRA